MSRLTTDCNMECANCNQALQPATIYFGKTFAMKTSSTSTNVECEHEESGLKLDGSCSKCGSQLDFVEYVEDILDKLETAELKARIAEDTLARLGN